MEEMAEGHQPHRLSTKVEVRHLMTVMMTPVTVRVVPTARGSMTTGLGGLRLRGRKRGGDPEGTTDLPAMTMIPMGTRTATPIATGEVGDGVMATGVVTASRPAARRG